MAIRIFLRTLIKNERGATAIEYGLIVALIVIALMEGLRLLGGGTDGMWGELGDTANTHL